jgi:prepilin-type N-terminal cleavage/methylation domain-containing protein
MQKPRVPSGIFTREPQGHAGFTLIELLIVIALITLILSLSTVFFANLLPSNRFKATVRDVSTTFRHARTLAQMHTKQQTVIFDLDTRTYGIDGRRMREIPAGIQIRIIDPMEGEILNGEYRFRVNTVGIDGGTIVLDDEKREARIQMDPIRGAVVRRDEG